ncbi:MAG: hypothetical protein GHCLOJNM_00895 [bacterium]|nr:hypothetical protein [bacterium]
MPSGWRRVTSPPPALGCWFWHSAEFEAEGYKEAINLFAEHSPYEILTTSLRVPLRELADPEVRDQISAAARYAREKGIALAMDLDVRLARRAFHARYPDELQRMLCLREVDLNAQGEAILKVESQDLSDHYTFNTTHYIPLAGELLRVYSYEKGNDGILPETVTEVPPDRYQVLESTPERVSLRFQAQQSEKFRKACAVVAFTHLTPDVFAPHLDAFQRELIETYRDSGIVGVCKDEWGFPPCFDGAPKKDDYWYSPFLAEAYKEHTGGGDFIRDALLMTFGEKGREANRRRAINHFTRLCHERNGAIETHFHEVTKEVFGATALVATHPTWYPFPDRREFKKNGLDWWIARRDFAQTDETTPFCVRTSLSKKWNSPVWYNMYYSSDVEDYETQIWSSALAGGRVNVHPLYPVGFDMPRHGAYSALLKADLVTAQERIHLLDLISGSPLDCPVAVVFGHSAAMNWAGPVYDDVGMALADALWSAGYPADLIPSSEIENGSLKVSEEGLVRYGPQRYQAVILYHSEFESPSTAKFFQSASAGKTALYRVGDWTMDFDAQPFDGNAALPEGMVALSDGSQGVEQVIADLAARGAPRQFEATGKLTGFGPSSVAPPTRGTARLLDGTVILVSGANEVSGDSIRCATMVNGHRVEVEAAGVVGIRLSKSGELEALAAGGLKRFRVGSTELKPERPLDLAVWRNSTGRMEGVVLGEDSDIPPNLKSISLDWRRLKRTQGL